MAIVTGEPWSAMRRGPAAERWAAGVVRDGGASGSIRAMHTGPPHTGIDC
ncbi:MULTISPECIES: hypothetical protein [Streptomycetaceae]